MSPQNEFDLIVEYKKEERVFVCTLTVTDTRIGLLCKCKDKV